MERAGGNLHILQNRFTHFSSKHFWVNFGGNQKGIPINPDKSCQITLSDLHTSCLPLLPLLPELRLFPFEFESDLLLADLYRCHEFGDDFKDNLELVVMFLFKRNQLTSARSWSNMTFCPRTIIIRRSICFAKTAMFSWS